MHRTAWLASLTCFLCNATAQQNAWLELPVTSHPSSRVGHGMVLEPVSGRVVLFGGQDANQQYLNDTWEWNGRTWTPIQPAAAPSPRTRCAMAPDGRGSIILYGGDAGGGLWGGLSDTWSYSNGQWSLLPTVGSPTFWWHPIMVQTNTGVMLFSPPQGMVCELQAGSWNVHPFIPTLGLTQGQSVTYDTMRRRVVVASPLLPTFEWDGTSWSTGPGFPSMAYGAMAFDPLRQKVVFFGGQDINAPSSPPTLSLRTYEYDGTVWQVSPPNPSPDPRSYHGMAFSPVNGGVLLFGGESWQVNPPGPQIESDTWLRLSGPTSPAIFSPFGGGCPGSAGIPGLAAAAGNLPWLGESFTMELHSLPTSVFNMAVMTLGFSTTAWGTVPLPLDLHYFGMPGCQLLVDPAFSQGVANTGGQASWTIYLPPLAAIVGLPLCAQGMVFDFGVNPANAVLSNGCVGTIGHR